MSEPLSAAERAAIQALHYEAPWPFADAPDGAPHPCYGCGRAWPCETDALLATCAALEDERDGLQLEVGAWDSTLGGVWTDLDQVTRERDQLRAAIADLRHGFRQKEVWGSVWGALNAVSHDHAGIKPSVSGAKRIVGALLPVVDNVLQHYLAPEMISAIALEARQVNEMRYRLSGAEYHRREVEEKLAAAEQRATRLAALEAAARACYRSEGTQAYADLLAAVAALDGAAGAAG